MTNKLKHTILAVDDEEGILKALKRLLRPLDVDVIVSQSGEEALKVLADNIVSIIISDQRMPKMTGVEFLTLSQKISPDSIRILLTGYSDINVTVDAINSGAVKYYFNKPWDDEQLLSRIKESLDMFKMTQENRRLTSLTQKQNKELKEFNNTLKQKVEKQTKAIRWQHDQLKRSYMETIQSFSTIIGLRNKGVGSHSERVASVVKVLMKNMDLSEKEFRDIVVAAFLHDIGKISLPDSILNKSERELTQADNNKIEQHPILGQSCMYAITGFEDVGLCIRHHHEDFSGGGYPDDLSHDDIPFGARAIRIADAFDHEAFKNGYPDDEAINNAMAYLMRYSGSKFDSELIKKFVERDIAKMFSDKGVAESNFMQLSNLREGMIVASDIYTKSGMFLLPKGAKLSKGMISRITKIDSVDKIQRGVEIYGEDKKRKVEHASIQNIIS